MPDNKNKIPPPFIEPAHIPDVLVSGIAEIEALAGCIARITFFVDGKPLCENAPTDRLVVGRIAIPINALPQLVQQIVVFLAGHAASDLIDMVQPLAH